MRKPYTGVSRGTMMGVDTELTVAATPAARAAKETMLFMFKTFSVEQIQETETTDVGGEKRVERTRRSERWIGETKVGSKEANGLDPEKMLSRCRRERKYREEMLMKTREDGRERV